jgi:hypothetical protein
MLGSTLVEDGGGDQSDVTSARDGGAAEADSSLTENTALQALLADWAITEMLVRGDEIWFDLAADCATCPLTPTGSFTPQTHQVVVVKNGEIRTLASGGESGYRALTMDPQQKVFAISFGLNATNDVVELGIRSAGTWSVEQVSSLFSVPGSYGLAIDSDGTFWLAGGMGLHEWNGTTLVLHDAANSPLPTSELHGLAVDQHGATWLGLGLANGQPTGIMQLSAGDWKYLAYSSIPALASCDYASVQCVDKDNNLWVTTSRPASASEVVRSDAVDWIPDGTGRILCDSRGTAWRINEDWGTATGGPSTLDVVSTLAYYDQGGWRWIDISGMTRRILSLDVYRTTLVLGTVKGIVLVDPI